MGKEYKKSGFGKVSPGGNADKNRWIEAAKGWNEWAAFKYQHPTESVPDRLEQLVKRYEEVNGELMEKAATGTHLTVNPYSHRAYYSHDVPGTTDRYSVSIFGNGGGGNGIKQGAVVVEINLGVGWLAKQIDRKVFSTHTEAVKYAEQSIKQRRKQDKV